MHVIVTHPNADFDAVASLLAVWRLHPDALPLLPNTLNRNVRNFITLHENQLPFFHLSELPRKPIDHLTIVDSQQVPDLKGLVKNPTVHIIDHHDLHKSLNAQVIMTRVDTGATVTSLVEEISKQGYALSPLEATLLLLGIYEDTGSLSYSHTTPRDLQASAWLLGEKQANLDIVREYLKYAMSDTQKALYEQVTERLETYTIQGHTIIVAIGTVDHYVEEISTIAHRLRDLYQPEALFLLVEMPSHVQMVARSTNDSVDTGRVTEFFGGGGHPRAAAALIKHQSVRDVQKKLIQLLKLEIQPARTVEQIMSKGAHTLLSTDNVRHAAAMMDRYGHEGFPVIDPTHGNIVGILSRREIDKALRHQLEGAAINQFMKKGEFFVTANERIEAVQKLMVEAKIGQIPVVNPTKDTIIGIVTRTDLIELWTNEEQPLSNLQNLMKPLEQTLSSKLLALLREAGELATGQGDTLYIVGGFVRDLCLTLMAETTASSPRFDLDLVVEGDAITLAERLSQIHGGRVNSHTRFGTAKWLLAEPIPFSSNENAAHLAALDFVTARTEFYRHPSALPEVEQSSIRQDLHRRDFTINTLALHLTPDRFGQLLDFYGGQDDLQHKLIRTLHSLSFVEDPTRMLRAARLMARLNFSLETRTAEHWDDALNLLDRVSGERIT
ncbi:MAG: CBS domain-containing protein, partial [Chloroflexota bacterium]